MAREAMTEELPQAVDWPHWPGRPEAGRRRQRLERLLGGGLAGLRYLLFLPGQAGYRLVEREGSPPPAGARVAVGDLVYVVARVGPSPLPGDRRPCAFAHRDGTP